MYKNKKITVYFPARNEAGHLAQVVDGTPDFVDEIIVVSNRSFDNTLEELNKYPRIRVLVDDRTIDGIGYGFAHLTALNAATGDILVAADADLTYPVHELDKILDNFMDNHYDFVTCTRYPVDSKTTIPFKLKFGVNFLNKEVEYLYGIKLQDTLSGMWVLTKDTVDKLNLVMGDWNLSPEIKIKAAMNPHVRYGEYHISQKQRAGETKQNYFKTGFDHALWILLNRFGLGNPKKMDIINYAAMNRWSEEMIEDINKRYNKPKTAKASSKSKK